MQNLEKRLLQAINNNDSEEAKKIIDEIFEKLLSKEDYSDRFIKDYLISLNGMVYLICVYNDDDDNLYDNRIKFSKIFESCLDIKDLQKCSRKMVENYLSANQDDLLETSNATVNDAIVFMCENLEKELTLGIVADHVHISKSYLSSLISKYAGYSFPNLLAEIRIHQAMVLLETSNIPISVVSCRCGFNSQSYFCLNFKKITGQTPSRYRNSKAKDQEPDNKDSQSKNINTDNKDNENENKDQ